MNYSNPTIQSKLWIFKVNKTKNKNKKTMSKMFGNNQIILNLEVIKKKNKTNRQSNWRRRNEVYPAIVEKKQISERFFGMETKKIMIDLQVIIQTKWKINFKKIIVTTYFISNTSNYVFQWKQKWSKWEEQQQKNKINNKMLIEMQKKLIEYINCKNTNFLKTKNQTKLVPFLKNLNKSTNL